MLSISDELEHLYALQFRWSANSETDEELEQLFKFATDDKSNIISLHRKKMEEVEVFAQIKPQFLPTDSVFLFIQVFAYILFFPLSM